MRSVPRAAERLYIGKECLCTLRMNVYIERKSVSVHYGSTSRRCTAVPRAVLIFPRHVQSNVLHLGCPVGALVSTSRFIYSLENINCSNECGKMLLPKDLKNTIKIVHVKQPAANVTNSESERCLKDDQDKDCLKLYIGGGRYFKLGALNG